MISASSISVFLPVLLPLLGGIILLLSRFVGTKIQQKISMALLIILVATTINSLQSAIQNGVQVYELGNWVAPFGIVLVLDGLSAMMLLATSLLAIAALWYAISSKIDIKGAGFHALFQFQLFGLNGAFLTGDLFNLFVFFEILLIASYGLLVHGGGKERTRAGLQFVVINLIGSAIFLFAVGGLYGMLGTLNIADLSVKAAEISSVDRGLVMAAGFLLLVVFGVKSAMFPLYLWLPKAYSEASAPVAALFAIMTKVGIYSIIRVHGTIFGDSFGEYGFFYMPILLVLGMVTLVMGALGVAASKRLGEQVSYLVLVSVSILLIGLGINTEESLSATLYYMLHSIIMPGAFFLLVHMISIGRGEQKDIFVQGVSMQGKILLGSTFMVCAVALTGMPPFSGFIGKFLILSSALGSDLFWWVLSVVLITGLIIIISLARSGSLIFYNVKDIESSSPVTMNIKAYLSIVFLLSLIIALVIFAGNVVEFTDMVSSQIYNSSGYIDAVLGTDTLKGARQ